MELKHTKMNYKNKIPVAAHRGNSFYFPENTLAAFRSAAQIEHLDMVETDVHMSSDGALMLMHDHTVDRTTNGTGLVREKTYAELRELDAGSWMDEKFAGEKIPTLEEMFDVFKDKKDFLFNVELKDYPSDCGEFAYRSCDKIIETIERCGVLERTLVNSWSGELLEYVAEKYGDRIRIHGYNPEQMGLKQTRLVYDYAYCMCVLGVGTEPFPESLYICCQCYGVEPWFYRWHCNEPEVYDRALELGTCVITSDDAQWLIDYLRTKGLHE